MPGVVLAHETDWDGFRAATRAHVLAGTPAEDLVWSVRAADDLFAETAPLPAPEGTFSVPRALVDLAETVIQAREPARFALLYALIHRVHGGERHLLEQTTDPAVHRAQRLAQAVRRDTHKMRAFLRFRAVTEPEGLRHIAWFEPDHYIVEANAPFFARRFATMLWSILTPYRSAHWDGEAVTFGPGAQAQDVPDDDALEAYWRAYFSAIFNPARLKTGAMLSEMPRKYWRNMPETAVIPDLVRAAAARTDTMLSQTPRAPRPSRAPAGASPGGDPAAPSPLARAAAEAAECRRCALWQPATQTVFGEGPARAAVMFVGEQPGDQEDLAGRPFVGPAGQLFDRALDEAGIDRRLVYVTNAVKHFKFEPRGRRRIHQKPEAPEIEACRHWLSIERDAVAPRLLVMLGATAARAVLGRVVTISRERGRAFALDGGARGFITVHPSFLLRLPDEAAKAREYAAFVADLRAIAEIGGDDIRAGM
ncbi:UdgX family uracil-DNA binding protein [Acidisphaera rubrifaciens]|uniref:Type-4 uracil-DNA glycosylase n=1 Tax=Acidisphaera rubrifaciens HS-AP3 TaxID=1231350 RepID=A0A0D6P2B5_9PROT|nr:UdgX family uracil-DNA binding protein [Acidisphaera rubrifaciens]GAN75797.1 DNA polymerase related protein/uracil-DNA glycosylase [Acidisphaera rubrifaciens HS-AP3]